MILTNRLNLPAPIVEAVRSFDHDAGGADASVTELLLPPRIATLLHRYRDEITEDVADHIWAFFGHLMALLLERSGRNIGRGVNLTEKRLYTHTAGWTISGTLDAFCLEDGILDDYKVTSGWVVKRGGRTEWEPQLNLYAMLLREWLAERYIGSMPLAVTGLRVTAFLRDWSVREAARDSSYPQTQVALIDIPMWDEARCRAFLAERVAIHQQARAAFADGVLPFCTPEEKWQKPPKGKGALQWAGVATRCQSYCAVAGQCESLKDGGYGPVD
jgi:hypothetical protein